MSEFRVSKMHWDETGKGHRKGAQGSLVGIEPKGK